MADLAFRWGLQLRLVTFLRFLSGGGANEPDARSVLPGTGGDELDDVANDVAVEVDADDFVVVSAVDDDEEDDPCW